MRIIYLLVFVGAFFGCAQSKNSKVREKEVALQTLDGKGTPAGQGREDTLKQHGQVVLWDIQGLWGGTALWISPDGAGVCQFVKHPTAGQKGLQATRYSFMLSQKERDTLIALIGKHAFFTMKTKDRSGVPDEARPVIYISRGKKMHAVGKWANDSHKDFDPLYRFLLAVAKAGEKGKQIPGGTFDWDWKPKGFPVNKKIWAMTSPKL
ncbi:hypothetical protein KKF84_07230 [Myxococcota bacterium]|nr:hypothetical protein [Myxococcota bacterium]MBU1535095.1 hypothetical protein [Myxococcota bacterium]